MKKALLVTCDFTQRGKTAISYAAARLISACKHAPSFNENASLQHVSIALTESSMASITALDCIAQIESQANLASLDCLILGAYVWNNHLIEPIIKHSRLKGFKGKVILGGYQIHRHSCTTLYPSADCYVAGYGEAALPKAILSPKQITKEFLEEPVDFESLASPYLDGTLEIEQNQAMVRWETRRGCQFKCSFCAHRDLQSNGEHLLDEQTIYKELDLFKAKKVKKINVLDPIFNLKQNHKDILLYAKSIGLTAKLSLQVRFELIDEEFLVLCQGLNVELEFGLQSAIKTEFKVIERNNNLRKVEHAIKLLLQYNQYFEVSLIYGLPGQTVASFQQSIDFLRSRGVTNLVAFPLMLLEGTELKAQKEHYQIVEGTINQSGIPHVIACYSFDFHDWKIMHSMAQSLMMQEVA